MDWSGLFTLYLDWSWLLSLYLVNPGFILLLDSLPVVVTQAQLLHDGYSSSYILLFKLFKLSYHIYLQVEVINH